MQFSNYALDLPGGLHIEYQAPARFHIPRALADTGLAGYEPLSMSAFLACVERSEGAVFDIGANIGLYSMVTVSALRRKVRAFEPFPDAAEVMRTIRGHYDLDIDVRQAALSDTVGSATFYLSAKSDMSNSLNPTFRAHRGEITVEVTTIDVESANLKPGAIKIDTETTEIDVLNGGVETFSQARPSVLFEVLDARVADLSSSLFGQLDYRIIDFGQSETLRRVAGDSATPVEGDARNRLALPFPDDEAFWERARYWYHQIASH